MIRPSSSSEWRALVQKSLDTSRISLMQLATLSAEDRPSVRTVVFRGWSDPSLSMDGAPTPGLKFVTDSRSAKMRGRLGWAEVCYYCQPTREQFRFTGSLTVAGPDAIGALAAARSRQWADMSDAGRSQFCWPAPGEPRPSDQPFETEMPASDAPVENFVLLVLECRKVDHYCSKAQTRELYRLDDRGESWSWHALNP